jgi:hypothetical protein
MDSLDLTNEQHPKFSVQGHLLSVDGDALITTWPSLDFWHLCLTLSDLSCDQFLLLCNFQRKTLKGGF